MTCRFLTESVPTTASMDIMLTYRVSPPAPDKHFVSRRISSKPNACDGRPSILHTQFTQKAAAFRQSKRVHSGARPQTHYVRVLRRVTLLVLAFPLAGRRSSPVAGGIVVGRPLHH